jgi:hypothetical protein
MRKILFLGLDWSTTIDYIFANFEKVTSQETRARNGSGFFYACWLLM